MQLLSHNSVCRATPGTASESAMQVKIPRLETAKHIVPRLNYSRNMVKNPLDNSPIYHHTSCFSI